MNDYFFRRRDIEARDGRFLLTVEVDEQIPGKAVRRRRATFNVWYDTQEVADRAREAWTDERLKKLKAFL
jgi:hypothetical protein